MLGLIGVAVLQEELKRRADDQLVKGLLLAAVHGDVDLLGRATDGRDGAVELGRVLEVVVHALPDGLGAVLPGPELAGGEELPHGKGVEVLEDVSCGNLVKVAVAKRGEGALPDQLGVLAAVLLEELRERHREILEVGVLALDVRELELRRGARTLVATLRNATVAVDVVALVLLVEQARQLVHLHDLLEKVDLL